MSGVERFSLVPFFQGRSLFFNLDCTINDVFESFCFVYWNQIAEQNDNAKGIKHLIYAYVSPVVTIKTLFSPPSSKLTHDTLASIWLIASIMNALSIAKIRRK